MCPENEMALQDNDRDIRAELNQIWAYLKELGARLAALEQGQEARDRPALEHAPTQQPGPESCFELKAELRATQARETAAQAQIGNLEDQLRTAESRERELEQELRDVKNKLEQVQADNNLLQKENADLKFQLKTGEDELTKAKNEITRLRKRELPCQAQLLELQEILEKTPANLVTLAKSRSYNFENLPAFLASCGKIENLRQLWEACANRVRDEQPMPEAGALLEKLLAIFNAAFPENQATLVSATCGDKYRYEEQDRGTSNGERIAEVLLPGMRTPGGTLVKCVVRLG